MTERYWHPSPKLLLDTVKRLDRILNLSYRGATTGRQRGKSVRRGS